jgi:hypothetical protein
MISVLDYTQLMVRVGALMRVSTYGWNPADEFEFQQSLPTSKGRSRLPSMEILRKGTASEADIRRWAQITTRLEALVQANDPH